MTHKPYSDREYWEHRYAKEDPAKIFDWYQRYAGPMGDLVRARVRRDDRILVLGCGNSPMSEQMYDDGYTDVVNIDWVDSVIERMRARMGDRPGLHYQTMDARKLTFDNQSFDVVIDKGTIDALACAGTDSINAYCREAERVLRNGGLFLVVSHGIPQGRQEHFDKPDYPWSFEIVQLATDDANYFHHAYLMRKRADSIGDA